MVSETLFYHKLTHHYRHNWWTNRKTTLEKNAFNLIATISKLKLHVNMWGKHLLISTYRLCRSNFDMLVKVQPQPSESQTNGLSPGNRKLNVYLPVHRIYDRSQKTD